MKRYAKIIGEFAMSEGILLENLQLESVSALAHFYKYLEPKLKNIFTDAYNYGRRADPHWIDITEEQRIAEAELAWSQYRDEFLYKQSPQRF